MTIVSFASLSDAIFTAGAFAFAPNIALTLVMLPGTTSTASPEARRC